MEENFGIEIADSELEKIRTIQDAIDFLKARVFSKIISSRGLIEQKGCRYRPRSCDAAGKLDRGNLAGICAGRSGIGTITKFDTTGFKTKIAGS